MKDSEILENLREIVRSSFGEIFESNLFNSVLFFNDDDPNNKQEVLQEILLDYIHVLKDNLELMDIKNFNKMKGEFENLTVTDSNKKESRFIIMDIEDEEKKIDIGELLQQEGFQEKIKEILSSLNELEKYIGIDNDIDDDIDDNMGGPDL